MIQACASGLQSANALSFLGEAGTGGYEIERPGSRRAFRLPEILRYFRCRLTSLVISNIDTWFLPPNTGFSFSSALIIRLFFLS